MGSVSFAPALRFSIAGKMFSNNVIFKTLLPIFREGRTYNSVSQCRSIFIGNFDRWNKNKLVKKRTPDNLYQRVLHTNSLPRTRLMDLEVAMSPAFFKSIALILNSALIKKIDKEFDMNEFIKYSRIALAVVAKLLSELKFSELDGLLTKECIVEVKRNVRSMEPAQRYNLAVELDDIYISFPYDAKIITEGHENKRTFFQITVAYHVCKNYTEDVLKNPWLHVNNQIKGRFTTYNCRFIKEFTKGANDQWIINGINVLLMHELTRGFL